jgi:hypothetical protein
MAKKEVKTVMVEPEKAKTLVKNAEMRHEIELQPTLEWDEVYIGLSLALQ